MDDLYDLHVPSTKHLDHSPKDISPDMFFLSNILINIFRTMI